METYTKRGAAVSRDAPPPHKPTTLAAASKIDVFAAARERFTIPEIWETLGLPGEPKPACKSPFRDERSPSFSIFDSGRGWKDHATGDGGDVIEFLRKARDCDHADAREWFQNRLGISPPPPPTKAPPPPKRIQWPGQLKKGDHRVWDLFSRKRGLSYAATACAVEIGFLRFLRVDGVPCYCITDATGRAAEIRRWDGELFFNKSKAYPLRGVDKSWPLGLAENPKAPQAMLCEGATDFLTALHLYHLYRKSGGKSRWAIAAMLGASCRNLHPQAVELLRGRHVRLVPDADPAGAVMAAHWKTYLPLNCGSSVDVVCLPDGTDLADNLEKMNHHELFTTPQP
jgi:hypothetical protein